MRPRGSSGQTGIGIPAWRYPRGLPSREIDEELTGLSRNIVANNQNAQNADRQTNCEYAKLNADKGNSQMTQMLGAMMKYSSSAIYQKS